MNIEQLHQLFSDSKGICTDTRKIEAGTIFFALKGANFNGNEYAKNALDEGCIWAVVDEEKFAIDERFILVDDVLKWLQDLANFHRRQFDIPVIGITGSNGKTTSKELIGAVLEKKYKLLITQGNLNNHLGVPFTLLRLNKAHEIAVIEMGANKPGDIQELVEIAEPNYGIITNIGAAHIEGMGSLQGIIETKTALYRWIDRVQGKIFINAEDDILRLNRPPVSCISYGEEIGDIQGTLEKLTPFVNFSWKKEGYESPSITTHLVGRYNFTNFLAAVAIGDYFKVEPLAINEALEQYVPSNNRSQVTKTKRNTLIVDCYNANATSMKAALNSFFEVEHDQKMVILGDMLELGNISSQEHQRIIEMVKGRDVKVCLVGQEFGKVNQEFPCFSNWEALKNQIDLDGISDHLILLKGSRGIRLENLIEYL